LYHKAVALNALGKYNESIAAFDKALAIDPSNTSALTGKKLDLEALNRTHITNKSVNVIQPKNLAQSNNTNILRIIIP
ncbi:MAG: tetratricopeptide repeat protein, partial [Thermoproteota archaeon]|nr:tetratricopeptide repeat protein [Thermoproteota archaeon]